MTDELHDGWCTDLIAYLEMQEGRGWVLEAQNFL